MLYDTHVEDTCLPVTDLYSALLLRLQDDTTGFSQLTVRVPSKQRFAAFNAVGKLVAGSLEQVRRSWCCSCWWSLRAGSEQGRGEGCWRGAARTVPACSAA